MSPTAAIATHTRRGGWTEIAALAAVFAGAMALRLPAPGADDLFYSGAAFSLAEHGELRNRLLDGQNFPCPDFLIYPPFYQYLLGGWLWAAGINTLTMAAFQQLWFAIGGLALCRVLQQHGLIARDGAGWAALFAVGFNASLGSAGMRPDICAFALLFTGFALRHLANPAAKLTGWSLLFGSLGVTPNVLPYMLLGLALLSANDGRRPALVRREGLFMLGGSVTSSVLLLVSISGRLPLFIHSFSLHATRAVLPPTEALLRGTDHFWHAARQQPHYWLAMVLALVVVIVASARSPGTGCRRIRWPLTLIGAVLFTLFASVAMTWIRSELRLFTVTVWTLSASAWLAHLRPIRWLSAGALAIWALCVAWQIAPRLAVFHAEARSSPAELSAIRQRVSDNPGRHYLVDSWSAREVFDYRLPAGARDWLFSQTFPALWPSSVEQRAPDDTWIISGLNRRLLVKPAPTMELRTALFLGHAAVKYYSDDFRVLLIPAPELSAGPPDS